MTRNAHVGATTKRPLVEAADACASPYCLEGYGQCVCSGVRRSWLVVLLLLELVLRVAGVGYPSSQPIWQRER